MGLLQGGLLVSQALLVLGGELLVVADLLLDLGQSSLQRRFLLCLSLLVVVDYLDCDEIIEGLARVFGDDGVDLGGGILWWKRNTSVRPCLLITTETRTSFLIVLRRPLDASVVSLLELGLPQLGWTPMWPNLRSRRSRTFAAP